MLFWSSSASSCSRLHMAACSSASRASSFSSSVRLWLLIHRAIFSAVCCYLFTFRCSPSVPGVGGGDPEQVVIVRRCGRWYYNCTSCPVSLGRIRGLMLNRTKTHVRREKPSKKSTNGRWCPFCANLRLKRHRFEGVFQCPLYFDLSDKKLLTCETVRLSVKPLSWHSISTDK